MSACALLTWSNAAAQDPATETIQNSLARGRGVLRGTLRDSTDRPLQAARISATPLDTAGGYGPTAVSDREGRYLLTDLAPGRYLVAVHQLGYALKRDTVLIRPGRVDTVGFVLSIDPWLVRELEEQGLVADLRPPRLAFQATAVEVGQGCYGVDSVVTRRGHLTVTGFKADANTPSDVSASVYRRGSGVVIDLFDISQRVIASATSCLRWRASIDSLPEGQLAVSVRQADDPRGVARTWLIFAAFVDTRFPTVKAYDPRARVY